MKLNQGNYECIECAKSITLPGVFCSNRCAKKKTKRKIQALESENAELQKDLQWHEEHRKQRDACLQHMDNENEKLESLVKKLVKALKQSQHISVLEHLPCTNECEGCDLAFTTIYDVTKNVISLTGDRG